MATATILPESYLALIREFPLRRIKSEEENDAAIAVFERLMENRKGLDDWEVDYLHILAELIHDFEEDAYPIEKTPPVRMIKFLMESRDMNQVELAKATGLPKTTLSEILLEHRSITPKTRNALAKFFNVDPSLFV